MSARLARILASLAALAWLAAAPAAFGPARAATPVARAKGARHAPAPAPRVQGGSRQPASPAREKPLAPGAPRRLDDIRIEGEIPVPQVLFITAREQRRFMEFQHHHYLKSSLELGRATATPSQIVVITPTPAERKEEQR